MGNMRMIYTNQGTLGTYDFNDNPSNYTHDEIGLENNERNVNAGLVAYNNGIYHVFSLSFDNIGTEQLAKFGTIFRTRSNITFFPMDETRGTTESFTVWWMSPFNPKLVNNFWGGGYSIDITLESC
jgi:hypothetical protein